MMYSVQANIEVREPPWTSTRQVPTFFLDESVQGILTEDGAVKIALEVLDPTGDLRASSRHTIHVTAVRL